VGFLLGGKLTRENLRGSAQEVLWISLTAAIATVLIVSLGLMAFEVSIQIAIVLGCIAAATAPTAIFDVINESAYRGKFSKLLLSIVAIDDVWALLLFAIGISMVKSMNGGFTAGATDAGFLLQALREIGGAILLGIVIGVPAAYLSGRVKKGEPILSEALGIVFICGGLAIWLEVSFLICAMVVGAVIANTARHHKYPFHAIEGIESAFMVVFFVLAGASLNLASLYELGFIGAVYILSRTLGKVAGARLGGKFSCASKKTKNWAGIALLPQAGVPVGMALVAANQFPEYRQVLLSVIISSTIFFDIIGPILTRMAIEQVDNHDSSSKHAQGRT
jgi:Kef-type K+ transport system membrane component KefB